MAVGVQQGQRVPTIFPLSTDQKNSFDLYTSDSFFQRLRRDYIFISNNILYQNVLKNRVLTGASLGGILGGLLTYVTLRKFRDEESTKDNKITFKIAGLGTSLGAAVGALFGSNQTIVRMERSEVYLKWKDEAIRKNIYPLFQKFLQDSDLLQEFLCDLTQDLISHPVRAPNGKIYEREEIESWLTRKAIEFPPERLAAMSSQNREEALLTFCPNRSCHLTSDMLVYDFDYHQRVAVAMRQLFDQQIDEQFREGLLNYRIALITDRESLRKEIINELTTKYSDGVISEGEFFEACRKCREHYNIPQ